MTELEPALHVAREAALAGGKIALGHFRRTPKAEQKPDGTWVTEADWAVEAQIRLRIARAFPDHNILGEEEGLSAAGGGPPNDGAPTWVIDPIDGTINFMSGIPVWGILVALRIDGTSVVGIAHAPALGETYEGAEGLGARVNGETIRVDPVSDLAQATLTFTNLRSYQDFGLDRLLLTLSSKAYQTRGFGDFWGHMLVARGATHVMLEPDLKLWDVAALEPIVTEAGGKLTALNGAPWSEGAPCLTTNGALHDEVVRLARGTPGPGG